MKKIYEPRVIKAFAWMPVEIGYTKIWLEYFYIYQEPGDAIEWADGVGVVRGNLTYLNVKFFLTKQKAEEFMERQN